MRFFVQCPCCPPTKWHWFDDLKSAVGHALDRQEYDQRVFGIDFDEVTIQEFAVTEEVYERLKQEQVK